MDNLDRYFISPTKNLLEKGITTLSETTFSTRDKVIKGFGLTSSALFLVLGLVYLYLTKTSLMGGCQKPLEIHGYTLGGIYLFLAVVTYFSLQYAPVQFVVGALPLVMFGLQVWGYYILLRDDGLACKNAGSKLWTPLMVLSILGTAGLGAIGGGTGAAVAVKPN